MGKSGAGNMGNVKMRGRKHKVLSCRCCICIDLREAKERRRIEREIREQADAMHPAWFTA